MTTGNQIELFEGFNAPATRAPKLGLPFQKSETIDVKRAAAVFRVSGKTIVRMCERGLLRHYKLDGGRANWQIEYCSVVEYCDRLRVENAISDSRAQLKPGHKRRRDDELLPFPFAQTIFIADAMARLECSDVQVLKLIECGSLVAYRVLVDRPGSPWRIHEPSLDRYIQKLHTMAAGRHAAKPAPLTRP